METRPASDRSRPRPALGFRRSTRDRVIAGVAGGLGERLGVDPVFVRLAFVALAFAGGSGILLYLLGWLVSDEDPADELVRTVRDPNLQQAVALGLIVLGFLLLLRAAGLWLGDELVWPVVIATGGSAVMWARGSEADRARWSRLASRIPGNPVASILGGRVSLARLVVGGVMIAFGLAAFLAASDSVQALQDVALASLVALGGAALVFGPWIARLLQELSEERRERIRSEERAEVAAHLHDSVLQTLALIQRSQGDARRMASLARRQERELRAWLYGRTDLTEADTLRAAAELMVEEVETQHDLTVETVIVGGELTMDDDLRALLGAAREALVNTGKHAKVREASLYVEVEPDAITAFVRDRGVGFDRDDVAGDRRGLSGSIEDRMQRHGGRADIWSDPGDGTEVVLVLPRHDEHDEPSEETGDGSVDRLADALADDADAAAEAALAEVVPPPPAPRPDLPPPPPPPAPPAADATATRPDHATLPPPSWPDAAEERS